MEATDCTKTSEEVQVEEDPINEPNNPAYMQENIPRRSLRNVTSVNYFGSEANGVGKYSVQQVNKKQRSSMLETIFEEPKSTNNELLFMSMKKFKRKLDFASNLHSTQKATKIKKRRTKIKRVALKMLNKRNKMSMDSFKKKFEDMIKENEP